MITVCLMLRLRQIREGREVSLRVLAKLAGVGVATLARMEAGEWDPRLSTLQKLAKTLGVTVGALIGETSLKRKGG
jgi:transcriptional regulator with XRE-family HTH domain